MKRMQDLSPLDRPRELIARKGAFALSDTELIEAVIGRGSKKRDVRALAKEIGSLLLEKKFPLQYDDLVRIDGIGPTKASQILACFELGRRYCAPQETDLKVTKPEDIIPLVAGLRDKRQEHFVCITLNGAGEVLGNRTVTVGLLNHSLVHPREVFADAIVDRAASLICVHNHPSGSLEPSPQDIAITAQLAEAGRLVGIQLLDHLIITKNGHLSLRERGLIP